MDIPQNSSAPAHIAIIMDGNGRWATERGLPREAGHKQGSKGVGAIARHCNNLGVRYLTLYAFSTENWSRPKQEIDSIMNLLRNYLDEADKYRDENIKTLIIGDVTALDDDLQRRVLRVQEESADRTGMTVNIALNYGGRQEIVRAALLIAQKVASGELLPENINKEMFDDYLYTANQPDPDFIIRPSGEQRLSNFLLWQCAYSELVFMDVLWPDFTPAHLDAAIEEFSTRKRRFGGI